MPLDINPKILPVPEYRAQGKISLSDNFGFCTDIHDVYQMVMRAEATQIAAEARSQSRARSET